MKKLLKKKKLNKQDSIALRAEQDYGHLDTASIARQRVVCDFQISTLENEIAALLLRVADARRAKAHAEAQVVGLTRAIARR